MDYRVREATQHAMNQMALRVGRNFAPHLKSVMGVWICSQCDPYLPVATAAQKAFSVAFSESKQLEVLGFCKTEVLEVKFYIPGVQYQYYVCCTSALHS